MATKLRITYGKSTIGYSRRQKDTVRSLGLRRLHQTVEHADTATIRGMIRHVRHLVTVEEIERDTNTTPSPESGEGRASNTAGAQGPQPASGDQETTPSRRRDEVMRAAARKA